MGGRIFESDPETETEPECVGALEPEATPDVVVSFVPLVLLTLMLPPAEAAARTQGARDTDADEDEDALGRDFASIGL